MKYPIICNWVSYSKSENGKYYVYDEAYGDKYVMTDKEFEFFSRLDGKTNPYQIQSDFTRKERKVLLDYLQQEFLIRKSRILSKSFGNVLVTLFSTKNGGYSGKKVASVADRMLSFLWFPVLITSVFYLINHYDAVTGKECIISGSVFGMIVGMVLHECAHAAACLRGGGQVWEFGIGFGIFPCAYVLLDMDKIKSRNRRAHVLASGIEMNFLLTGTCLYLSCLLRGAGGFLFFAALQNGILALFNLISTKDIDGMGIISEYLGCSNLFGYAKRMIVNRERRRELCHSGINGLVTIAVCYIALFMQLGIPLLVAFNLAILII